MTPCFLRRWTETCSSTCLQYPRRPRHLRRGPGQIRLLLKHLQRLGQARLLLRRLLLSIWMKLLLEPTEGRASEASCRGTTMKGRSRPSRHPRSTRQRHRILPLRCLTGGAPPPVQSPTSETGWTFQSLACLLRSGLSGRASRCTRGGAPSSAPCVPPAEAHVRSGRGHLQAPAADPAAGTVIIRNLVQTVSTTVMDTRCRVR